MRARLLTAVSLVLLVGGAGAQQVKPRITVRVRQVAGTSLYLDVGTRNGLATGDTLDISSDSTGTSVGRLAVTASTESRSVLSFVGEPFPVTRGATLTLHLLREPEELPGTEAPAAASPARPARASPKPRVTRAPVQRPSPHGRIGLDVSADRSSTRVGTEDPATVDRTFATPAFRFDATVPGVMGGFRLRTSMRLSYRYSSDELFEPASSIRVYAAALERDFTAVPLRVTLGRFRSPFESYSGFWDGALLRYGHRVGVGAIVGFEPDRWDERPSTSTPKVTVFVDGSSGGPGWRWSGDFSAHAVRPTDSLPDHTFFGASQRLSAGRLHVAHDLQVDRGSQGNGWRLSRLRINGSLDLAAGLVLRGAFARREPWVQGLGLAFFAPRNTRVEAGLGLRGRVGFVAVDGSRGTDASGRETWGGSGSFSLDELPGLSRFGVSGTVARWSGAYGTTLSAAPSVSLQLDPAWLRLGYRYNRSDFLDRVAATQAIESALDIPFASGLRAMGRARIEWGAILRGQSFDLGLYRIF